MPQARIPGKRGRLPALPRNQRLAIKFVHEYARQPLPAPTYPVDVTGGITDWGMLGNGPDPTCTVAPDGVGDCTYAARQHLRMAKAARGHETEKWETANQLVEEYLAYDGGVDQGANIAQLLQYWYETGKILAFAPVDHTDRAQLDAAMSIFSGLYVGVDLTDDADDLFANHQPWTLADGQQPDSNDGHCIIQVFADGNDTDAYVTWGGLQKATTDWTAACVEEAWVIITSEDEADHLIDLKALQADINALGGTQQETTSA